MAGVRGKISCKLRQVHLNWSCCGNREASTSLPPRLCLFIESIDCQNQWATLAGGRGHLLFPRNILIKSRPPKFSAVDNFLPAESMRCFQLDVVDFKPNWVRELTANVAFIFFLYYACRNWLRCCYSTALGSFIWTSSVILSNVATLNWLRGSIHLQCRNKEEAQPERKCQAQICFFKSKIKFW